ncbi:hypothetical protein I3760_10G138000 [Carya illinoinensis]|nr:hypothetical protein I3760_10G138000 [Carya illinoinensis]
MQFLFPNSFHKNTCVMCGTFPPSPNKSETHMKITICHDILSRYAFSTNKCNFFCWRYSNWHMGSINSSNTIFKVWPISLVFTNFFWNILKFPINGADNIDRHS